jgi:hypothetical protein
VPVPSGCSAGFRPGPSPSPCQCPSPLLDFGADAATGTGSGAPVIIVPVRVTQWQLLVTVRSDSIGSESAVTVAPVQVRSGQVYYSAEV